MATKTDRPRVLIEQWLPIAEIGAECMRERGASSALPPLYFLHVWWARRPLTVSRAAILASVLPAYPTGDDDGVRPWPAKFCKRFPTFTDYKAWFKRLLGIFEITLAFSSSTRFSSPILPIAHGAGCGPPVPAG